MLCFLSVRFRKRSLWNLVMIAAETSWTLLKSWRRIGAVASVCNVKPCFRILRNGSPKLFLICSHKFPDPRKPTREARGSQWPNLSGADLGELTLLWTHTQSYKHFGISNLAHTGPPWPSAQHWVPGWITCPAGPCGPLWKSKLELCQGDKRRRVPAMRRAGRRVWGRGALSVLALPTSVFDPSG